MDNKLNLNDLIDIITKKTIYKKEEIKKILNFIIQLFRDFLKNRDTIELRGFGTFYTKEHKAKYIKLKTKTIDSKNHFVILFKESIELSKKLNSNHISNDTNINQYHE